MANFNLKKKAISIWIWCSQIKLFENAQAHEWRMNLKSNHLNLCCHRIPMYSPHHHRRMCMSLCLAAIRCYKFLGKNPDESWIIYIEAKCHWIWIRLYKRWASRWYRKFRYIYYSIFILCFPWSKMSTIGDTLVYFKAN